MCCIFGSQLDYLPLINEFSLLFILNTLELARSLLYVTILEVFEVARFSF